MGPLPGSHRLSRKRTRSRPPLSWPPDPAHTYELWLEPVTHGRFHAYVTAHRVAGRGLRSRFAVRLDLPGAYANKAAAEPDAYEIARRFFHHPLIAPQFEVVKTVKDYQLTVRARFRIDCHAWEPVLWIKSSRPGKRGATQAFEGSDSPFVNQTFATPTAATRFACSYGERLVLGLIRGLNI